MKLINKLKGIKFKDIHISKFKIKKRYMCLVIAVILVLVMIAKHFLFKPVPMVTDYVVLEKGEIVNSITATGKIQSNDITNIHSEVDSIIEKVNVEEGDKVKEGDILAVLKKDSLENDIRKAEEQIRIDNATNSLTLSSKERDYKNKMYTYNNQLDKDIESAKTNLAAKETTLKETQKTYECNEELFKYGEISEVELEKSKTDYEAAKREYDEAVLGLENAQIDAEESLKKSEEDYRAAQISSSDKSKQLDLEDKKKQLEQCVIRAPKSGTITKVNAVEGGSSSGILFVIKNLEDVYIDVPIKEVDILDVKVGQKVEVRTDVSSDEEFVEGEVIKVTDTAESQDSSTDSSSKSGSSGVSSSFKAKIKLKNIDNKIKVGMDARVKIIIEEAKDIYTIPFDSVSDGENGQSIFVLEPANKNKYIVKEINVTTGMESDVNVEIRGSGLKNGLKIMSDPTLYPVGTEVELADPEMMNQGGEAVE